MCGNPSYRLTYIVKTILTILIALASGHANAYKYVFTVQTWAPVEMWGDSPEEACSPAVQRAFCALTSPPENCQHQYCLLSPTLCGDTGWHNTFSCPYHAYTIAKRCDDGVTLPGPDGSCASVIDEAKNIGGCPESNCPSDMFVGNPINIATGNKFQTESDYAGAGPFPLRFQRYYNSNPAMITAHIGMQWRHNFNLGLNIIDAANIDALREDGKILAFFLDAGEWRPDPDVTGRLTELTDGEGITIGWQYLRTDDTVESYAASGKLTAITDRSGMVQTLDYEIAVIDGGDGDPLTLDRVTDPSGRTLTFNYDVNGRLASMTAPGGEVYLYAYDPTGNLAAVTYPDETPGAPADNPLRLYHYEDANHPYALTGITDETGNRFATWGYDVQGRAIMSEYAGGNGRVDIIYNSGGTATVVNSLGDSRTFHFAIMHGVAKTSLIDGEGVCSGCGGDTQDLDYDANGFVSSRTDFNGNVTAYIHDARGLETARTEAVGTADERTITTIWHPEFRLPTQITEPGQITTFTYDAAGRLLTREVIAQ